MWGVATSAFQVEGGAGEDGEQPHVIAGQRNAQTPGVGRKAVLGCGVA